MDVRSLLLVISNAALPLAGVRACSRPARTAFDSVSRLIRSRLATSGLGSPSSNRRCACSSTAAVSTAAPRVFLGA
jgi:hypothetical protein